MYLATVIDCYSRKLVGWSITEHMRTELVADALKAAAGLRGSLAGTIFHHDRGAQGYTSKNFAALCTKLGVTQSMGAVGASADNSFDAYSGLGHRPAATRNDRRSAPPACASISAVLSVEEATK